VSILVPARNEEGTLPTTLPTVLKAAANLQGTTEVLVIAPSWSPVHVDPPVRDPMLRWIPTADQGKFPALWAGATEARGDIFILIDADVIVHPTAFSALLRPMDIYRADVVAGRIEVLLQSRTPTQRILER
jgi:glycosyltransferase involved in cell wall biosynthesis